MKKLLLFAVIAAVFGGASVVSTSCGGRASGNTDTLRINTTEMTRDIQEMVIDGIIAFFKG